jgi:putative (di)nucleoside polyphosphate hydrolase
MKRKYRPNVAAIIRRPDGRVLICRRSDYPESWQFPQGGVDEGETLEQALTRELWEEIGIGAEDFRIAGMRGGYHYLFPGGKKKGWAARSLRARRGSTFCTGTNRT